MYPILEIILCLILAHTGKLSAQVFLEKKNLFDKCTIQFIADFEDFDIYTRHVFQTILLQNQYSPIVLDQYSGNTLSTSRYGSKLRNLSIPIKTAFSAFRPKYNNEIVVFAELSMNNPNINQTDLQTKFTFILHGLPLSNENPGYIFFQLKSPYIPLIPEAFLEYVTLTSKFLFYNEDYFSILCFPCYPSCSLVNPKGLQKLDNLHQIKIIWKQYNHYNLQNRIVTTSKKVIGRLEPIDLCVANFGIWIQFSRHCVPILLGIKHNFTIFVFNSEISANWQKRVLQIDIGKTGTVADRKFNEAWIVRRSHKKWDWYTEGISFEPYTFLVIAPMSSYSFETLILPFDAWTWILSLISFVLMGVTFTLLTMKTFKYSFVRNIRDKFLWSISVIFDQTDDVFTSFEFKGAKGIASWIATWYFYTFILGIMYKGSLFSYLTSTSTPNVPRTLQTAVESGWPILSTSYGVATQTNGNKLELSILKKVIIPDLLHGLEETDAMRGFLAKLQIRTHFVTGNKFDIGFNITKGIPLNSLNFSKPNINLPVILLDPSADIELVLEGIRLFSKSVAVVRNYEMLPFITRIPWCGPRNLLYPILAHGLGQLSQSGIYAKWQQLKHAKDQLDEARTIKNGTLSRNDYKLIYAKSMARLKKEIFFSEATSLSFEAMKYTFACCAIVLVFGLIAFVIEIQRSTTVKEFKQSNTKQKPYAKIKYPQYIP